MKSELYKALKTLDHNKLNEEDKSELIRIFIVIKSSIIRNQIAFIFSDLHYDDAVPYIIKKVNHKKLYNNNGSLVYALHGLNTKPYFIEIIRIVCDQGYEARLEAFGIIQKDLKSIPEKEKREAIEILEEKRIKEEETAIDKGVNSKLHFIEQTQKSILKN